MAMKFTYWEQTSNPLCLFCNFPRKYHSRPSSPPPLGNQPKQRQFENNVKIAITDISEFHSVSLSKRVEVRNFVMVIRSNSNMNEHYFKLIFQRIKSSQMMRGETGVPGGKPLRAEWRTNKFNPHMTPSVEIEPNPH